MRLLAVFLVSIAAVTKAEHLVLENGTAYIVPEEKVWLVSDAPVSDCDVCTADVYISGEISNVEVEGVIFHGDFDFSFIEAEHAEIKLYPGTEIRLGDSRRGLNVRERDQ